MHLLLLVAGLATLVGGAELLVRGAARLAARIGISPLIVGLTVVAFGTSAPELAVSVAAAWSGNPGIALGNVVGSNIFNVLFILGVASIVAPLVVARQIVWLDVPVMIGLSVVVLVLALDGHVGRAEGLVLVGGLVGYTTVLIRQNRKQRALDARSLDDGLPQLTGGGSPARQAFYVAAGLALLVLGSRWLVAGAVGLARTFGMSDLVVGLTIVAAGTSAPEVATSIVASVRGQRDIAVGNVVGSNIFNVLCVLGVAAAIAPAGIPVPPAALLFDIPVMIAVAVACLPIVFTGHLIARWEGFLFLGYYVAYTLYVVLDATDHELAPVLATGMTWFVLPLTALTLAVVALRTVRGHNAR
jgi:cation:H+ antiporter